MKGLNERVANEIKGLEEEEEGVGRTRSSDEKFRNTLLEIHPSNFSPGVEISPFHRLTE